MFRNVPRRTVLTGGLSLTLVGLGLAACGSETKTPEGPAGPFPESWDEALTMDVFDGLANQMGEQPGWFGAMVSKDFNLTLNVIARLLARETPFG